MNPRVTGRELSMIELVFILVPFFGLAVYDMKKMAKAKLKESSSHISFCHFCLGCDARLYSDPYGPSLVKMIMTLFGIKE